MKYEVKLHTRALKEFDGAFTYYEKISRGLGRRFAASVDNKIRSIKHFPKKFQIKYKNIRQAGLKDFPFVIVYEVFPKEIFIYSFFHTSKNPKSKFKVK